MPEALIVSYSWQPENHALVHPGGITGRAPCAGMKDGIGGINMSRWQRRELLAAIHGIPHPYVWLDALSILATLLLGSSPEQHGSWLHLLPATLITRIMAVYVAGGNIVVLGSSEPEGIRYHQRAWTLHEYCGSRTIAVCSKEDAFTVSFTPEEDSEFLEMRRSIKKGMKSALPL
jgi:hypothetical protein